MSSSSRSRSGVGAAALLMAVACGGGSGDAPGADGYQVVEVAETGVIRGTVRAAGALPPARTVLVGDRDVACGQERTVYDAVVGPDGGLANAVVSLIDIERGAALPAAWAGPVLDQRDCEFVPHVVLVPVGETVSVRNSDPVTHNVHTVTFDNAATNRSQPVGAGAIELAFSVAERVKVQCDMHGWMTAWIVAVEHPYHAVTDDTGAFVLSRIPPGTYTLEVWHETLGSQRYPVTVVANDTTDLQAELIAPG